MCLINQRVYLALARVTELGDLSASLYQTAHNRVFLDDLSIILGIRSGWNRSDKRMQICCPANSCEFTAALEFIRYRNRIGGVAVTV